MSEEFYQWAVEPRSYVSPGTGIFTYPWQWYVLLSVTNCRKIRLSVYHRDWTDPAYWGEISHEYDTPFTGEIWYIVTSNDARLASVASSWGLPHPLTDPGNSEILFIDWQHGVGDFEYWGNIDTQVRLQNIYVSTRSTVPDEEDPEWSGVVPVKGRYRWFMFAYTRGNELIEEAPSPNLTGTVYDGSGEKTGELISARKVE